MACTTPNAVFFHIPKTGGTWVTESLLRAFPGTPTIPKAERMNVDVGWEADITGIHISPTKVKYKKFAFTFVRHPITWWQSYYLLNRKKSRMEFEEYVMSYKKGHYTWIVKQFEGVDFIGRTENLVFDLEDALIKAGDVFSADEFLAQHANVSMAKKPEYSDKLRKYVLKHEKYIIDKYYDGRNEP